MSERENGAGTGTIPRHADERERPGFDAPSGFRHPPPRRSGSRTIVGLVVGGVAAALVAGGALGVLLSSSSSPKPKRVATAAGPDAGADRGEGQAVNGDGRGLR